MEKLKSVSTAAEWLNIVCESFYRERGWRSAQSGISFPRTTDRKLDNTKIIQNWLLKNQMNRKWTECQNRMHVPEQDLKKQTTEPQNLLNTFFFKKNWASKKDNSNRGRPEGKALILCGSEMCLGCIDVVSRELLGSGNNWAACGLFVAVTVTCPLTPLPHSPILSLPVFLSPSSLLCLLLVEIFPFLVHRMFLIMYCSVISI